MTTMSTEASALWDALHERYELAPHEEAILRHALEALDEMRVAQAEVREYGVTIAGRDGRKANPATRVVAQCRADFLAGMRALGIDPIPVATNARKGPYGPKRRTNR